MKRLWIASALALAIMVPGARAVSAIQHHPEPTVSYRVRPGDSLWTVARRAGMTGDRRRAVSRLMDLNDLASPALQPGQVLRLPAR